MAWTAQGIAGSTGNATANSTSISVTLNTQPGVGANVGDLLIANWGTISSSTIGGTDNNAVLSTSDPGNNTWNKVRGVIASSGSGLGQQVELWYSHITTALTTADAVTCIMGSSASRDFNVGVIQRFSKSGGSVRVVDSTYAFNAASSVLGALDLTAPDANNEFLRYRVTLLRSTAVTYNGTASYSSWFQALPAGSVGLRLAGEYKIVSASTSNTAPTASASNTNCSIYALIDECQLMGDGEL